MFTRYELQQEHYAHAQQISRKLVRTVERVYSHAIGRNLKWDNAHSQLISKKMWRAKISFFFFIPSLKKFHFNNPLYSFVVCTQGNLIKQIWQQAVKSWEKRPRNTKDGDGNDENDDNYNDN